MAVAGAEVFATRSTAVQSSESNNDGRIKRALMPASFSVDDPNHWRGRAEEARTLADEMSDEVSKQMMLSIAADYERLAERAALRAQRPKGSSPAG